jgi:hypothetical protein
VLASHAPPPPQFDRTDIAMNKLVVATLESRRAAATVSRAAPPHVRGLNEGHVAGTECTTCGRSTRCTASPSSRKRRTSRPSGACATCPRTATSS